MEHHAADWATTRPVVSGTQGVVAAGHPLVSMAGMRMLLVGRQRVRRGRGRGLRRRGGRADRVLHAVRRVRGARPRRAQRGETLALSGQGTAPAPGDDRGSSAGAGSIASRPAPGPDAHLSFTVPGAVDAYLTLLETHGTKTRERGAGAGRALRRARLPDVRVHAPPARHPGDAEPVRRLSARRHRGVLSGRPRARGRRAVRAAGARRARSGGWSRPTRGAAAIGTAGIAAARARFYRGDIAADHRRASPSGWAGSCAPPIWPAIARGSSRRCARPSPAARSSASRRGRRGPCSCRRSACSRRFDLRALGHNSARYIHVVTEALKLAFADRERYYGDARGASRDRPSCSPPRTRASAPRSSAWTARRPRRRRPAIRARRGGAPRGAGRRAPGAPGAGGRGGGRRHHAHRGHRPRRQHDLPDAERRRVPEVGVRPRAGLHAQHAERDVRARGRPSQRRSCRASGRAPRW